MLYPGGPNLETVPDDDSDINVVSALGKKYPTTRSQSTKNNKSARGIVNMAPIKTIVFGPTGKVGSAVAQYTHQQGTNIVLAMRDPQKSIPTLTPEQELEGGYERVQADLANPESVAAAVEKTAAKRAFIYVAFTAADHMKLSITALKSAGIEFVVFLSSLSVQGDRRSIQPNDFVAWTHAQVEINLEEVFGVNGFVAVRPAFFASNALWYRTMVPEGEVKMAYPNAKFDWISPSDIGAFCATLLARGSQGVESSSDGNAVFLCGPEQLSQGDAIGIIGRLIGKDIKVTELDEQRGLGMFMKAGLPEPVAKQLVQTLANNDRVTLFQNPTYERAVGNFEKYIARKPMRFEEWAELNKSAFVA
jgi:uncharacterized protein YbjT (DUF2867 family)